MNLDKTALTVSEISKLSQSTPDTVRYYVSKGLLHPSRHPENGYKLFNLGDVKTIKFIRQAKSLGFTLNDIHKILTHSAHGESPCPAVRVIIQRRIDENKAKLNELVALQKRMENALKKWQQMPDGEPNGDAICHLIESMQR